MSVKGFDIGGTIEKYDYNALDNLPEIADQVVTSGTGDGSIISISSTHPNTATGDGAFAVGMDNEASGNNSVSVGFNNLATGIAAVAIGGKVTGKARNQATQAGAVAIGQSNQSNGYYSIAMGREAVASGAGAVALGYGNTALGNGSFAAGGSTTAGARCSSALGNGTNANGGNSFVAGKFNVIDDAEAAATTGEREFAMIVGNGVDDDNRSNAMTLDWDGNLKVSGDIIAGDKSLQEINEKLGSVVGDGLNLLYFTNSNDRTLSSGLELKFEDANSIEITGTTTSIVSLPLMGNTACSNTTLRTNLDPGTYTYKVDIVQGTGATTGTSLYYRESTSGTNYGFKVWSSETTLTFDNPVEIAYRISANKEFIGRICKMMLVKGTELPYEYTSYKQTAIDEIARNDISIVKSNIESGFYVFPSEVSTSTYYTESDYSGYEMQGLCTDGTYLYFSMHGASDSDNAVLGKISLSTGSIVEKVSNHVYGHANGICCNPNNSTLLIADMTDNTGKIYVVDSNTLSYQSEFTMESKLRSYWENYSYGDFAGIGGVGYSEDLDKYVFLIRKADNSIFWGFAITDNSFNLEKLIKCKNITNTISSRGGLACDNKHIYMCEQDVNDGVRTSKIVIYDYNGNIVSVLNLSGLGYSIEGIAKLNDGEYYSAHSNNVIRKLTVTKTGKVSIAEIFGLYNFN